MELTPDQLKTLEQLGSTFISIKECAVILEVEFNKLLLEMKNDKSEAFKAYYRGWHISKHALHKGILKQAERGSNPAQQMMKKILDDAEGKNELGQ